MLDGSRRPDDGHTRGAFRSRLRPHERSQVATSVCGTVAGRAPNSRLEAGDVIDCRAARRVLRSLSLSLVNSHSKRAVSSFRARSSSLTRTSRSSSTVRKLVIHARRARSVPPSTTSDIQTRPWRESNVRCCRSCTDRIECHHGWRPQAEVAHPNRPDRTAALTTEVEAATAGRSTWWTRLSRPAFHQP
jgi:hypothetical protein